jgi:hypothetical protein
MLQTILKEWDVKSDAKCISQIRLKSLPLAQETVVQKRRMIFERSGVKYTINTGSSIANGTNGKLYSACSFDTQKMYLPLIAKRVAANLSSFKESIIQALAYEEKSKNIPKIYSIFRTKYYIWIIMQDLRYVTKKGVTSYCLHTWLENASIIYSRFLYPAGIRKIINSVFNTVNSLSKKFSFCHGDLHVGNIYIQSSPTRISRVILIDFGYSMITNGSKHSSSPYWLSYKDGIDGAIFLWSLYNSSTFQTSADSSLLGWISSKLLLTNGVDLKSFKNLKDVYEKLENSSSDDLIGLKISTLVSEFPNI